MKTKKKNALREHMVNVAADLIGDSSEHNPEYRRGITELIANTTCGAREHEMGEPGNAFDNVDADITLLITLEDTLREIDRREEQNEAWERQKETN